MSLQTASKKRLRVGITRVRTGCNTCRRRRVKCDETKPECRSCRQLGRRCEGYAQLFKFCEPETPDTVHLAQDREDPQSQTTRTFERGQLPHIPTISGSGSSADESDHSPAALSEFWEPHQTPLLTAASSQTDSRNTLGADAETQVSPLRGALESTSEDLVLFQGPSSAVDISDWLSLDATLSSIEVVDQPPHEDRTHLSTMLDNILARANESACRKISSTVDGSPPPFGEDYLTEWHTRVVYLLPPVFRVITTEMPELPPLKDAVLAISAANVAHLESLIVRTTFKTRKTRYIPQKDHQVQSLQFYDRGIRGARKCLEKPRGEDPVPLLAALLLFYYFELDSGSFNGGVGHMTVIDKFVESAHEVISSNPVGRSLLRTWMELRSQSVCRYLGCHRSSNYSDNIDAFPLGHHITDEGSDYDSITIMMCDSKLLSRKLILDWCVLRGGYRGGGFITPVDDMLARMSLSKSRERSPSQLAAADESYHAAFTKQQARLEKWHSRLSLSELPIDSYTTQSQGFKADTPTGLEIRPLQFHSFEAAMRYVYYAHAQMMCSYDIISRLKSPTIVEPPFSRASSPWVELALRIVAGLDISDCIYRNAFSTGILTILSTCIAACPRADVASWIEAWTRKVEDHGVPLEEGLPFGLNKRLIRFLLDQRRQQRDILVVLPSDIEDAEKSVLYHSDFRLRVVACGVDMHTGQPYYETHEIAEV